MAYFDVVQEFIEGAKRATRTAELGEKFAKSIAKLGGERFVCVSSVNPFDPPKGAIAISNYPKSWARRFLQKRYDRIDPVMRTCETSRTPFFWSDPKWRATLTLEQLEVLREAAEHGLSDGVSIPLHSPDGYPASCSVSFGPEGMDPEAIHAIHLMSIYLHETALRIRAQQALPKENLLSPRQRECLEYVAQGKSDWAIGKILGLSENTVHVYVNAAMKRLNATTRAQAIANALFQGQIRYADVGVETTDETLGVLLSENEQKLADDNHKSPSM